MLADGERQTVRYETNEALRNFEGRAKNVKLLVYYSKTAMFLKLVHFLVFLTWIYCPSFSSKLGK
jgi:hypothetical protein